MKLSLFLKSIKSTQNTQKTRKCGKYCCIATCSLACAQTRWPTSWLALSRTRQNLLTLTSTCLHLPELLYTRPPSLVHLQARTLSKITRACSHLLTLARTRSHSLAFARACQNFFHSSTLTHPPVGSHPSNSTESLILSHLLEPHHSHTRSLAHWLALSHLIELSHTL